MQYSNSPTRAPSISPSDSPSSAPTVQRLAWIRIYYNDTGKRLLDLNLDNYRRQLATSVYQSIVPLMSDPNITDHLTVVEFCVSLVMNVQVGNNVRTSSHIIALVD